MDRLTCMTSFVKVVENAGFSAAARRLNVSPSVVTGHVKTLEDHLGVRLLNRSTRKLSLTEVGQAYFERCQQILAELNDADQIAERLRSQPRGMLQLNVAPIIPLVLAPIVAEYTALYPDVAVRMTSTSREVDMVEEAFDLCIRTPVSDQSLIVRHLATYRYVLCGAPAYFARRGHPKHAADIAGHNCITYYDSPWNREWHFETPDGTQVVRPAGNLQVNSPDALRIAATLGQGLIYVPSFLVADGLRGGELVQTLAECTPISMTIDASYPHRQHLSPKVRAFIDLAAKRLQKADWAV
ncbi:MAG TPA: LysR family transcriptional regulator [Pseudolabrys sp.]|nr:LysR family transcriptional regulator [Pseudolabrys sp.]